MGDVVLNDGFTFSFPVYVVIDEAEFQSRGLLNAVAIVIDPTVGEYFPFFTDADLASEMANEMGVAGKVAVPLTTMPALWALLTNAKQKQVSHVGIDADARTAGKCRFHPAERVIDRLQFPGRPG